MRVTPRAPSTIVEIVTDDMPFLVDSLAMELARQGAPVELLLHPVVPLRRDERGRLREVSGGAPPVDGATTEAVMRIELAGRTATAGRRAARAASYGRCTEVRTVVAGLGADARRCCKAADDIACWGGNDRDESAAFLRWLADDHLTFVALRDVAATADPTAR